MRCRTIFVVATFALSSSGMAAELPKSVPVEGRFYSHNVQKMHESVMGKNSQRFASRMQGNRVT